MSRVFQALRQLEKDSGGGQSTGDPADLLAGQARSAPQEQTLRNLNVSSSSRLVALTEPRSIGAEKFRSLATRLDNLRRQGPVRSLQITSSSVSEGKTLVATNLAVTFAKHSHSRVLLIEGDLYRPGITTLLGLPQCPGISHWWSQDQRDLTPFLQRISPIGFSLLTAGDGYEDPSKILHSDRFAQAFQGICDQFDWVVIDSPPMLPVADVNLWSRLVDGTLLVIREGVALVKILDQAIQTIDNLKLLGVVMNGVSESDHVDYPAQYKAVTTVPSSL